MKQIIIMNNCILVLSFFTGDCEYTLVEDFCGRDVGSFRILIENVPCGEDGVTCTKSVKFMLYDTTIHLVRGAGYTVVKDPSVPMEARYKMEVVGLYLVIKTPDGM